MCGWIEGGLGRALWPLALLPLLALAASAAPAALKARAGQGSIGTPLTKAQIAAIDRDVRFDGAGLPPGRGAVAEGEALYAEACAGCHGDFAEGDGAIPALIGGEGTLGSESPLRTVGSFWPYAPTLFDYIRRAMPEGSGFSLSAEKTYALVAYLLNINGIVPDDFIADARSLPRVRMPNRDGFLMPPHPRATGRRCMRSCRPSPRIVAQAPPRVVGVMAGEKEMKP